MINFEELRIKDSELLGKEKWNGLLDDAQRFLEGNVGLGVDAPAAKLHIQGKGGANVDLLVNGRIRSDNNDGGLWVGSDRFVGGTATNKIGFYNNNAWRLLVQNDGNVEISGGLQVRRKCRDRDLQSNDFLIIRFLIKSYKTCPLSRWKWDFLLCYGGYCGKILFQYREPTG